MFALHLRLPLFALLAALLVFPAPASAARETSDVVVLKNGDFHVGTVAQEVFTITTDYGDITVAYGLVSRLFLARGPDKLDILISWEGERFTGRLKERSLFVLRGVFGPSLPVAVDDIDRIEFHRPKLRPRLEPGADVVTLRSGDLFRAHVLTDAYLLRTEKGIRQIARADVAYVDVDAIEDEETTSAQVRDRDGDVARGLLLNSSVLLSNRHGQDFELPVSKIGAIAFGAVGKAADGGPTLDAASRPGSFPPDIIVDRFTDDWPAPAMVVIKAGSYLRGDLSGGGDGDEKPVRAITLAKPFAIGLFPVTFDEYDHFADRFGRPRPEDEGWGRGRRPVINVSWEDAVTYAKWLSDETGQTYRLPTDAEWEFAARAGTAARFWWGAEAGHGRANCSECGSLWDGENSSLVGRFPPNAFGLYDMAGNVWERVADCWHDKAEDFPSDGSALDKEGCGKRIIRGGAWSFPPKEMRAANRWRDFPTRHSDDTGFRLVRELGR